jgi:hypothetical protein
VSSFFEIAAALLGSPGGWRVEQLRFELRRRWVVDGRRWIASSLLACVERPARDGGAPALAANAHVHLWPPRLPPDALRGVAEPPWLRAERARFVARGWGVSWDPANGRFGWLARPLPGDLSPLLAERDFLEGAFGFPAAASPPGARRAASMAAALEAFRDRGWGPSALLLARRALPAAELAGTIDLELRIVGPPAERRASSRPLRAECSLTLWLPREARRGGPARAASPALRVLVASARRAGYRARWHIPPQGQSFLQMHARTSPGLATLRRQLRLLDGFAMGDGDR